MKIIFLIKIYLLTKTYNKHKFENNESDSNCEYINNFNEMLKIITSNNEFNKVIKDKQISEEETFENFDINFTCDSIYKHYDKNGNINQEGTFKNGNLHSINGSICKLYYENGKIKQKELLKMVS